MRKEIVFVVALVMVVFPAVLTVHALSPYWAGFKRGQDDTTLQDTLKVSNHTVAYDQGYVDGWCSVNAKPGDHVGSDSDNGTFDCYYDTTAAKNNSTTH